MKPGERIRLITESADSLRAREWATAQLILDQFGFGTYEPDGVYDFEPHYYFIEQIKLGGEGQIRDLHEYLRGDDAAPGEQQTSDRPWGSNPVAVFISHRHEDAPFASNVRDVLATRYGIDAFVAHNDINPSAAWREKIRSALASCHFMVAVLHEKVHESQWCDQEVGWAMGRGVPVMPVRRQALPPGAGRFDGFMEEHQDCVIGPAQQFGSGEWWLAEQIFLAVLNEPKTRTIGIKALAEAFVHSGSWDNTRKLWPLVEQVDSWDSEQLRRLEYAVQTNREIYDCNVAGIGVPLLVKQLVEKFEPPNQPGPWMAPCEGEPPY